MTDDETGGVISSRTGKEHDHQTPENLKLQDKEGGEDSFHNDGESDGDARKSDSDDMLQDRGWAWMVVLGCFMSHLITGGLERSDGVFFIKMTARYNASAQTVAWAGALSATFMLSMGPIASAMSNRFSTRTCVMVGAFLYSLGLGCSGVAPNTATLLVSFGLVQGIGRGFTYAPGLVIVSMYFNRRRGLAVGLATAGVGAGTFILPPLLEWLFQELGFTGAFLVLSAISLNFCVVALLYRPFFIHRNIVFSQHRPRGLTKKGFKCSPENDEAHQTTDFSLATDFTGGFLKQLGDVPDNLNDRCPISPIDNEIVDLSSQRQLMENPFSNSKHHLSLQPEKQYWTCSEGIQCKVSSHPTGMSPAYSDNSLEVQLLLSIEPSLRRSDDSTPTSEKHQQQTLSTSNLGTSSVAATPHDTAAYWEDQQGTYSITKAHSRIKQNPDNIFEACDERYTPALTHPTGELHSPSSFSSISITKGRRSTGGPTASNLEAVAHSKRKKGTASKLWRNFVSGLKTCFPSEKQTEASGANRKILDWTLFRKPAFLFYGFSICLFTASMKSSLVFLPPLVKSKGISEREAAFLLSISGVLDTIGRILCGVLLELKQTRHLRPLVFNAFIVAICLLSIATPFLTSFGEFGVAFALFGFFTGAYVCQKSVILTDMLGAERLGSSFGLLSLFQGLGNFAGPPLSGVLKDTFGEYREVFFLGGAFMAVAAALMLVSNLYSSRAVRSRAE